MKNLRALSLLSVALAAIPTTAFAQWAYPTRDLNLRAGPAIEYPVVARIGIGTALTVEGCLDDYHWCDVIAGPYRGWVNAGNIVYPYENANVPILTHGPYLGIGIVAFALGSYWDSHYRYQPWYPQQQYWINRHSHRYAPAYPAHRPAPGFGPRTHFPQHVAPGFRPGPQAAPTQVPHVPHRRHGNHASPPARGGGPGAQIPQRPAPAFRSGAQAATVQVPAARAETRAAPPPAAAARADGNRPVPQQRSGGHQHRSPQERNSGGR